jgi:hypothetical protein
MRILILTTLFFLPHSLGQNYLPPRQSSSRGPSDRGRGKGVGVGLGLGAIGGGMLLYWFGYRKLQQKTTKLETENNDLLEYIKLQTELHQLQQQGWKDQILGLENSYQELYRDSLERDYEEFKAPDGNQDELISSEEVRSADSSFLLSSLLSA